MALNGAYSVKDKLFSPCKAGKKRNSIHNLLHLVSWCKLAVSRRGGPGLITHVCFSLACLGTSLKQEVDVRAFLSSCCHISSGHSSQI